MCCVLPVFVVPPVVSVDGDCSPFRPVTIWPHQNGRLTVGGPQLLVSSKHAISSHHAPCAPLRIVDRVASLFGPVEFDQRNTDGEGRSAKLEAVVKGLEGISRHDRNTSTVDSD